MNRPQTRPAGILLAATFVFLVAVGTGLGQGRPKIEIVFRYDALSERGPFDFETRLISVFVRHKTPLTVGVIPYVVERDFEDPHSQAVLPLSETRAAILREGLDAGILDVAQMGYSHQTRRTFALGPHSEFGGLDPQEIDRRIRDGKTHLERLLGRTIVLFIPPWDVSDPPLLRSLERNGFAGVLPGFEGGRADQRSGLTFLASTVPIDQFYAAVKSARASACPSSAVVVGLHPDDFTENNARDGLISLDELAALLADLPKENDLAVVRLSDLIGRPDFDAKAFERNKAYYHVQSLAYPWLEEILNLQGFVYFCPSYLQRALPKAMILLAFYTLGVFAVCWLIGYKVGTRLFEAWRWMPLAVCSLTFLGLAGIVFDIMRDWDITYKGWTGLLMFGGCLLGELVALIVVQGRAKE